MSVETLPAPPDEVKHEVKPIYTPFQFENAWDDEVEELITVSKANGRSVMISDRLWNDRPIAALVS
jgi:hypothetical protein